MVAEGVKGLIVSWITGAPRLSIVSLNAYRGLVHTLSVTATFWPGWS